MPSLCQCDDDVHLHNHQHPLLVVGNVLDDYIDYIILSYSYRSTNTLR